MSDAAEAKEAGQGPMLFANYYTWYATGAGRHERWTHWVRHDVADAMNAAAKRTGDVVKDISLEDSALTFWPLAGLYDSDDPEIIRWHIQLAKAAGIEAFLVDWWGPGGWQRVPGLTKKAFEAILPIAEEEGFKIALLDEPVQFQPLKDSKKWAAEYLSMYKDHPAYLRIDGKPVYYVYQVPFDPGTTPEEFTELKTYVEERVGTVYWFFEAISNEDNHFHIPNSWLETPGIDAFSFYGTFSIFRAHEYEQLIDRFRRVVRQAHGSGRKMCLPVHPGHDNLREGNPERYKMPRRDGQTFRDYLRAATDAGADHIMVTSFNEWPESTIIEPSSCWEDPYQYLKILADWRGVKFVAPEEPLRVRQARAASAGGADGVRAKHVTKDLPRD